MVTDQGVDVLLGERSSWRTISPASGAYAELPLVSVEALCVDFVQAMTEPMA